MKERIQFLLIYFSFWVTYFLTARIVFIAYHIEEAKLITLEQLWGTFANGLRMDMSVAAFLSFPAFVFVLASPWIKKSIFERILFSYTIIFVILTTFLIVVDLEVYNVWKFRLDSTPLNYLNSTKHAWVSLKASPVFKLFVCFLILFVCASFVVYRIIGKKISTWKFVKRTPFIITGVFMTLILIIPMRGGLQKGSLEQKSVYFSDNLFANTLALNPTWNFVHSLRKGVSTNTNTYAALPNEELKRSLESLYPQTSSTNSILKPQSSNPNVIVLFWEGLSTQILESPDSKEVLPFIDSLKNESLYFNNFFSVGDRNKDVLPAVLSGFPSMPKQSILDYPSKVEQLPSLPQILNSNNYQTEFYYCGELEEDQLDGFVRFSDFKNVTDSNSFPEDSVQTEWGVYDHLLFTKFLDQHKNIGSRKFFSTVVSASSQAPYELPTSFSSSLSDPLLRSLQYTDQSLKEFISQAKVSDWWENTIVIILGNHGGSLKDAKNRIDEFRVPMIWTGGAVNKTGTISNSYSQLDLPHSILNQLNIEHDSFKWSKDIFAPNQRSWAFFTYNDGFGFIEDQDELLFDNIGGQPEMLSVQNKEQSIRLGKALQQASYDAFLNL